MKLISIILLFCFTISTRGQELNFVPNVGHQSIITFIEESRSGDWLFTGTEDDIICWNIRDARIINRNVAEGKFNAVALSDQLNFLVAIEEQSEEHLIHLWDATTNKLVTTLKINELLPPIKIGSVLDIKYYERLDIFVWADSKHLYVFDVKSKKIKIDPGLSEKGRYIKSIQFSNSKIIMSCTTYEVVKNAENIYQFDVDKIEEPPTSTVISDEGFAQVFLLPKSDNLLILKWQDISILNLKTNELQKIKFPINDFPIALYSSVYKPNDSSICYIASGGKVLILNFVTGKSKVLTFETFSFDRSRFSHAKPDILYVEYNEKIYLLSIKKDKLEKSLNDNAKLDEPSHIYFTKDRQLVCQSRYTNTTCNILNVSNLSFREVSSKNSNVGFGFLVSDQNRYYSILADYSSHRPNSEPNYMMSQLNLDNDSVEAFDLAEAIPRDSLSYPRFEISKDQKYFVIFSKSQVYWIDRKTRKLVTQFAYPARASIWNNGFKRPFLFLKDGRHFILADNNIVQYDLSINKVNKIIEDELPTSGLYSLALLNHDSSRLIYANRYRLYSVSLESEVKDTVGYFEWLSTVTPVTSGGNHFWMFGYENGVIELRDSEFKKVIFKSKIVNGRIKQILFDTAYSTAIINSGDGKISFIDINTFKVNVTGYLLNTGKHSETGAFLFNDKNEYYLSANLTGAIHLLYDGKPYDYQSLDPYLNRPGQIASQLNANKRLISQLQFATRLRDVRLKTKGKLDLEKLPTCWFVNKEKIPFEVDTNRLRLSIQYSKKLNPLRKVVIKDNNITLQEIDVSKNKDKNTIEILIELVKKENHIQIFAEDSARIRSLYESLDIEYRPKDYFRGKLWFVGMGISKYPDTTKILDFSSKDVKDLADNFKRAAWPEDVIISIVDSQVFKAKMPKLKSLLELSNPEDYVIIYYSGHAIRTDKGLMLCYIDTDFDSVNATGYPFEELLHLFDGIKARKRLVVIDACESGDLIGKNEEQSISPTSGVNDSLKSGADDEVKRIKANSDILEFYNSYFSNFSTEYGVQVIAAAYGNSSALEKKKLNNSLFTSCFIKGLFEKKADPGNEYTPPGRWYPDLRKLRNYIYNSVISLSNGKQIPSTVYIDPYQNWNFHDILIDF